MRPRRVTVVLLAAASLVVPACGTTERSGDTTPTESPAAESGDPTADTGMPATYLRYGVDGLVRVTGDDEQLLLDRPIGWANSDGAGGVLFTELHPYRFGPTQWLASDRSDPILVSEWDDRLIAARLDRQPAAVGALPTEECAGVDAEVHMVARALTTGETTTLQCGVGGQDAGRGPDSFGGGLYVGVAWDAVHPDGYSTALRLVFRNAAGDVIDHPGNPYAEDCHPCELTAALSPDGTRLAVIHRPDAPPFRPDEYPDWAAETVSVDAELQVFDLATGDEVFARQRPAHAGPPFHSSWFDGRYVVLDVDPATYPALSVGDAGDGVRTLQQMLIDAGADIEVDGVFGPATQDALEAFHTERFGAPRSWMSSDTWTELGAPNTIIDTHTGTTTEVPGTVALEITLSDGPTPDSEGAPPQLSIGDTGKWVETLQQELVRHGYHLDVDGVFGPTTDTAVRDFQAARGLTVDGIVGPKTWSALTSPTPAPPETESETTPPATTPESAPAPSEPLMLAADRLGPVDFGTPADDAVDALSALLGPPDQVAAILPIGSGEDGCVEGATWLDCLRELRIREQGQLLTWTNLGLDAAMVDTDRSGGRAPLQLGDWHAIPAAGAAPPTTAEGLYAGMSVGELRSVYPSVGFDYNEGLVDGYVVDASGGGQFWGRLDPNPATAGYDFDGLIRAVQAALNERGADLAVDGEWGPRAETAWNEFLTSNNLPVSTLQLWVTPEIGDALGLPPDDWTVATLEPRPA